MSQFHRFQIATRKPFPGPRPFRRDEGDLLYGRARELDDLCDLLFSYPSVLLYAQSGAGKTSLVNAKLQPALEENHKWRVYRTRVIDKGREPSCAAAVHERFNRFAFHTLRGTLESQTPDAELAAMSVGESLARNEKIPTLLILDQLEDMFLQYPRDWKHRRAFFGQIADAIKSHAHLRVLFVIREDFLARMEPYAIALPNGFNIRYRLERLRAERAKEAITQPLAKFKAINEEFTKAFEKIIQSLRASKDADGALVENEFIEPLELQLVCDRLWSGIEGKQQIDASRIEEYSDINAAIVGFYERVIAKVVTEKKISEARIRDWCGRTLISPSGTRDLVFVGETTTEGLPSDVVELLTEENLVQVENRENRIYCELPHDRFVDAIRRSNEEWWRSNNGFVLRYWKPMLAAVVGFTLFIGGYAAYHKMTEWSTERKQKDLLIASYEKQAREAQQRQRSLEEVNRTNVDKMEEQRREFERSASTVSEQLRALDDRLHLIKDKSSRQGKALQAQIASLEIQRTDLTNQQSDLAKRLEQTNLAANSLRAALQDTQRTFERAQTDLQSKQHDLQGQLGTCRAQFDTLNAALVAQQRSLTEAQQAVSACDGERSKTLTAKAALDSKIAGCPAVSAYISGAVQTCPADAH